MAYRQLLLPTLATIAIALSGCLAFGGAEEPPANNGVLNPTEQQEVCVIDLGDFREPTDCLPCQNNADCEPGDHCFEYEAAMETTMVCFKPECGDDLGECEDGRCDVNGFCIPECGEGVEEECEGDLVCMNSRCVAEAGAGCDDADICEGGLGCVDNNNGNSVCAPCTIDAHCSENNICLDLEGDNGCVVGCREGSDCGAGESCTDNVCTPDDVEMPCDDDDDCAPDELCGDDQVCVPQQCAGTDDCEDGEACFEGRCVAARQPCTAAADCDGLADPYCASDGFCVDLDPANPSLCQYYTGVCDLSDMMPNTSACATTRASLNDERNCFNGSALQCRDYERCAEALPMNEEDRKELQCEMGCRKKLTCTLQADLEFDFSNCKTMCINDPAPPVRDCLFEAPFPAIGDGPDLEACSFIEACHDSPQPCHQFCHIATIEGRGCDPVVEFGSCLAACESIVLAAMGDPMQALEPTTRCLFSPDRNVCADTQECNDSIYQDNCCP